MVPENREFDFGQTENCKSKSGEPENHDILTLTNLIIANLSRVDLGIAISS